jgi:hypothetical protein
MKQFIIIFSVHVAQLKSYRINEKIVKNLILALVLYNIF